MVQNFLAREILDDAAAVDAEEDERFGDARGDELPSELANGVYRDNGQGRAAQDPATGQGRQKWLRDAKRRLDERRTAEAKPIPKSRPDRLKEAKRRLEEEHQVECRANAAYEDYRRHGRMRNGRRRGAHSPPKPLSGRRRSGSHAMPPQPRRRAQRQCARYNDRQPRLS